VTILTVVTHPATPLRVFVLVELASAYIPVDKVPPTPTAVAAATLHSLWMEMVSV